MRVSVTLNDDMRIKSKENYDIANGLTPQGSNLSPGVIRRPSFGKACLVSLELDPGLFFNQYL